MNKINLVSLHTQAFYMCNICIFFYKKIPFIWLTIYYIILGYEKNYYIHTHIFFCNPLFLFIYVHMLIKNGMNFDHIKN